MKKILLTLVGLIVLAGIIFAAKIVVARPNDPQEFVNTALTNSLEINSAKKMTVIQIAADANGANGGKFTLAVTGKIADAAEYLPTLNYQIESAVELNLDGQKISGKLKGELKIIDEVFYGKFEPITLVGAPEEVLARLDAVNQLAGKWHSLSFAKLRKLDPKIATEFEEQKTRQLERRANLKNLFATTNFLLVKKMPINLTELQPVEVVLNTDVLASDTFLTEIEKMFTPTNSKNPLALDEATWEKIRETITALADKIDSTITLQINHDNNFLRTCSAEVNLALADFGIPQFPNGTVQIFLDSQNSEINQPQLITTPTEFTELDPSELLPRTTEEVFDVVEE